MKMVFPRWKRPTCFVVHLIFVTCIKFFLEETVTGSGSCFAFSIVHTRTYGTNYLHEKHTKKQKSTTFYSEIPSKVKSPTHHQEDRQNGENFHSTNKEMYLISFPNYDESVKTNNEYTKRLWMWKDTVFGKGGIYFNSKMKSSKAFHQFLKKQPIIHDDMDNTISFNSCVILSNCARMDILLCLDYPIRDDSPNIGPQQAISFVAKCLAIQMVYFRKKKLRRILSKLPWDLPSLVCMDGTNYRPPASSQKYLTELTKFLESNLVLVEGNEHIARHFCLVSSGLATRPRYSSNDDKNQPVFRPFSSWDAHVMKQIKKSAEISECTGCSSVHTKLIFDYALQAGKAARNPKILPALQQLQNKPNLETTTKDDIIMSKIVQDVHDVVIEPTVRLYMSRMIALNASKSISDLYETSQTILSKRNIQLNSDEGKEARKILHEPVMRLRRGEPVNTDEVLHDIEIKFSPLQ